MSPFSRSQPGREGERRRARTRPVVTVESLEGRALLSRLGALPRGAGPHPAEFSSRDASGAAHGGQSHGGQARKAPHYFEAFDNIGNRPDLNAVRASVELNLRKNVLTFAGTMQGRINVAPASPAANSLYVFGVNRGSASAVAPFALRPGVVFDSVVVVSISDATGTTASVVDLTTGVRTALSASAIHIKGREVRVDVDASLLPTPSGGVPARRYTFNLWPRESTGPDSTIASFIPENGMAPISVIGRRHG